MTFYILSGQMTTLLLSLHLLTTLTFPSEIQSFLYGGSESDVFFQVTNNNKTLAIKPNQSERFSNLLVVTKEGRYYFTLDYDESSPHQFIEIQDGLKNHALKELVSKPNYQVMEGASSVLFINKQDEKVRVNGREVDRRAYFSKGVPLFLGDERILN